MRGIGCVLYIRCALSIHQKECRKSLGCALYIGARYTLGARYLYIKRNVQNSLWCALYIGARYLPENMVIAFVLAMQSGLSPCFFKCRDFINCSYEKLHVGLLELGPKCTW
jgi:hypothetical protein